MFHQLWLKFQTNLFCVVNLSKFLCLLFYSRLFPIDVIKIIISYREIRRCVLVCFRTICLDGWPHIAIKQTAVSYLRGADPPGSIPFPMRMLLHLPSDTRHTYTPEKSWNQPGDNTCVTFRGRRTLPALNGFVRVSWETQNEQHFPSLAYSIVPRLDHHVFLSHSYFNIVLSKKKINL